MRVKKLRPITDGERPLLADQTHDASHDPTPNILTERARRLRELEQVVSQQRVAFLARKLNAWAQHADPLHSATINPLTKEITKARF